MWELTKETIFCPWVFSRAVAAHEGSGGAGGGRWGGSHRDMQNARCMLSGVSLMDESTTIRRTFTGGSAITASPADAGSFFAPPAAPPDIFLQLLLASAVHQTLLQNYPCGELRPLASFGQRHREAAYCPSTHHQALQGIQGSGFAELSKNSCHRQNPVAVLLGALQLTDKAGGGGLLRRTPPSSSQVLLQSKPPISAPDP